MTHRIKKSMMLLITTFMLLPAVAQTALEPIDTKAVELIRAEGLENSNVMNYMSWMTDVFGPRLTGSPALDAASNWAVKTFEEMGLKNVEKSEWGPFGRGWTLKHFNIEAHSEYGMFSIIAYPKAWSPGTNGKVAGEVVLVSAETMAEVDAYKGKLKGKVVMIQAPREVEEPFEAIAERHSDARLLAMANAAPQPRTGNGPRGGQRGGAGAGAGSEARQAAAALRNLVLTEMPIAVLDAGSKGDYGTVFVSSAAVPTDPDAGFGGPRAQSVDAPATPPQFTVAVEHYNRIARMLEKGIKVNVNVDLQVEFTSDDLNEYNVIAEIPGTDPEVGDEIVMIGAHFDSWHAGTGATDNAAGSSSMMEAMRILKKVYAEQGKGPRRTIRIGLWTGEEQGLLGSRAYVSQEFAESAGRGQPPTSFHPDYDKFSGYFNMDNGSGRIRGIHVEGNEGVAPIFRQWLVPFHDLDAATITLNGTGGTDHLSFDGVGLPGFQFIQDGLAYSPKTHHSNMDVYDHTIEADLKQAATIIASFVYHTSERNEKLPRKPLPVVEVAGPTGR